MSTSRVSRFVLSLFCLLTQPKRRFVVSPFSYFSSAGTSELIGNILFSVEFRSVR